MKTVCEKDRCTGCMACLDVCPKNTISIVDEMRSYNAIIGTECVECGLCHQVCQVNHPISRIKPKEWYQGWSKDSNMRLNGSSGGFAMDIASSFIAGGGIVCSCAFVKGEFIFKCTESLNDLKDFAGSKYVKSIPIGIYKKVNTFLKEGKKILFIALPCQVAAMKKFVGERLEENLYTIDLICHGSPSPKVLELFLKEHGYRLKELKKISFRNKEIHEKEGYKSIVARGISDSYMIAFLDSLIYTENCYNCQYANVARVSDLTLGDSWGSTLPKEECKKGISLLLCQTDKGKELLDCSNLYLEQVNLEYAIARNHQLLHPSIKPLNRDLFFNGISNNKKFDSMVFRCTSKKYIKQRTKQIIKRILGAAKLIKLEGITFQIRVK